MVNIKELQGMLDLCSRCGNCQQICPLYAEVKQETAVARGKLHLISLLTEREILPSPKLQEILDFCLLCGRCADLCQNGVSTNTIIVLGRSIVNQSVQRPKRKLIRYMLRKDRLKTSFKSLYLLHKMRIDKPLQYIGKVKPYWPYYQKITLDLKKDPLSVSLPKITQSTNNNLKIAYFIGCMNNLISQSVGQSMYKILTKLGFSVVIPEQKCCGMPAWTNGDLELSEELVRFNVQTFNESNADLIVTDCASCGHALKHLTEYFLKQEGKKFQTKVLDISELLFQYLNPDVFLRPYSGAVAFHDPCHLRYGQKIKDKPRSVLKFIPDLRLIELNNPGCCGFAGTFMASHLETSQILGSQRANSIIDSGVNKVITSCPACQLQLDKNLRDHETSIEVLNLVEFIDQLMK